MKLWAGIFAVTAAVAGVHPIFERAGEFAPRNRIDELVAARWKQSGIQPAHPASDSVFLRRAYLDVTGTLPTAQEAAEFLSHPDRGALIDRLLARDEFADYQAMKWSDLLRVKAEFPVNLWPNAAQAYYHWIRSSIRQNQPYDRFVRELLTTSGSNFRDPPVNFYRAMQNREPQGIAQTVALTFMGTRTEKWPAARLAAMAAFFTKVGYKETREWKEEIVLFDPGKKVQGDPVAPAFPDGTRARIAPGQDPREVFATWLTAPRNPWFARAIVNRIWYWLLGRGIVEEPDDLRDDNPPENPELLAYLERELVESHYDLRHIYRLILNSSVYQLSPIPPAGQPDAALHFAHYPTQRLDAEVLIDALCQITGTIETYTSSIPEPYTFMPDDQRSIALPDGSITSPFLELFGRPPRDTGLESERNNHITDAQRLHLLNSTHIQRKIQQSPRLTAMMRDIKSPQELVSQIYLTVLSRYPSAEEWKLVQAHSQSGAARGREAIVDLVWGLFNSMEFLCRH
jgi:hypothetical protein